MKTECDQNTEDPHSKLQSNVEDTKNSALLCKLIIGCRQEMKNNFLNEPLTDYVARVMSYTGLPKMYINEIISKELKDVDYDNKYLELPHRIAIYDCLASMYINNQIPTYYNIYELIKKLNIDINIYQLQYILDCLGFQYRTDLLGNEILIEDPNLTFERYLYLKQIKNLRLKDAPIYYVDEIFLDSTLTFTKLWIKNIDVDSEDCDGYVFFHAISKKGFLNGLFCSPTTTTDFIQWITYVLLPLVHQPSIFVMDKNGLHRSRINYVTKYDSKEKMVNYLKENNIPCNENMHKAELYKLISECSVKRVRYDLDEILKSHGHQILWLPSTFHDLSITHFLWKHILYIKPQLFENIPLELIKNRLIGHLVTFPEKLWHSFDADLYKMESIVSNIDSKAQEALETKYKFTDDVKDPYIK